MLRSLQLAVRRTPPKVLPRHVATSSIRINTEAGSSTSGAVEPPPPAEDEEYWRSIVGAPLVNTYKAIKSVGYDGEWEAFVKHVDFTRESYKKIARALGRQKWATFDEKSMAVTRRAEARYIMDCWNAFQRSTGGNKILEPRVGGIDDFLGGNYVEWNKRRSPKSIGKGALFKVGLCTLVPPEKEEDAQWFRGKVGQWGYLVVGKVLRGPLPDGKSYLNLGKLKVSARALEGWSAGKEIEYRIEYDKASDSIKMFERGADEPFWSAGLAQMAQTKSDVANLLIHEGLITKERWEGLVGGHGQTGSVARRRTVDTFELSKWIEEKKYFIGCEVKRGRADDWMRAYLLFTGKEKEDDLWKKPQEIFFIPSQKHVPDQYKGFLNPDTEPNEDVERLALDDDGRFRFVPYIACINAYPSSGKPGHWDVDVRTPNDNSDAPTMYKQEMKSLPSGPAPADKRIVLSGSPETLRVWSPDLKKDIVFEHWRGKTSAYRTALTGEEVKRRWPKAFVAAQGMGYWKDIEPPTKLDRNKKKEEALTEED